MSRRTTQRQDGIGRASVGEVEVLEGSALAAESLEDTPEARERGLQPSSKGSVLAACRERAGELTGRRLRRWLPFAVLVVVRVHRHRR